ncbi:MAG: hypothetical protein ACLPV8_29115 [Steroidobacteraceae bacterium]
MAMKRTHLVIGNEKLRPVEGVIQVMIQRGTPETEARGRVYGAVKWGKARIARKNPDGEIVELSSDQAVNELLEDGIVIKVDEFGGHPITH